MTLAQQLAAIRDEIGLSEPPTDTDLEDAIAETGHWILAALRVLKRRRADLVSGSGAVQSVNLTGILAATFGAGDIKSLDAQIARLEARYTAETAVPLDDTGQTVGQARRVTYRG